MFYNLESIRQRLIEKYKSVYTHTIDNEVFMYKLLSKLEYELITTQYENELDMQDAIIDLCVLYPEDLDVDEMLPGHVHELSQLIVEQSCVLLPDRLLMLQIFSEEMNQLDNVICSLIMHAFPVYKLEELENMEYPELYKLYTRAEWHIKYILKEPLEFSAQEYLEGELGIGQTSPGTSTSDYYANGHDAEDEDGIEPQQQEDMTQGKHMGKKLSDVMSEINNSGSKRKPMTAEQQKQLDEFKRQFPEMHMEADAMYTGLLSEKAGVVRGTPKQKY